MRHTDMRPPTYSESLFCRRWYKTFGCATPFVLDSIRHQRILKHCNSLMLGFAEGDCDWEIVEFFINSTAIPRLCKKRLSTVKQAKKKLSEVEELLNQIIEISEKQERSTKPCA